MVNWAAMEATKKESSITLDLLEVSLWNIAMGRERKSLVLSEDAKKLTSYHESGHAIVALFTEGSSKIRKATLIPRGQALGMVNFLPGDDELITKKQMQALMDTAMGGRAAEEIIFGKENVTQGASSDFSSATRIAKGMIIQMGMSEKVGHIHLTEEEYLHVSPETKELIESEVRRLVEESYSRAVILLKSKETELHRLAKALITYETLELEEIQKIILGEKLIKKDTEIENLKRLKAEKEKEVELNKKKREIASENEKNKIKKAHML